MLNQYIWGGGGIYFVYRNNFQVCFLAIKSDLLTSLCILAPRRLAQGIIAFNSGQYQWEATVPVRLSQHQLWLWRDRLPPQAPAAGWRQGSTHCSQEETQLCCHGECQIHQPGALRNSWPRSVKRRLKASPLPLAGEGWPRLMEFFPIRFAMNLHASFCNTVHSHEHHRSAFQAQDDSDVLQQP